MGIPLVMLSHTQVNKTTITTIYNYIIVIQFCIHYQEQSCCSLEKIFIIISCFFFLQDDVWWSRNVVCVQQVAAGLSLHH